MIIFRLTKDVNKILYKRMGSVAFLKDGSRENIFRINKLPEYVKGMKQPIIMTYDDGIYCFKNSTEVYSVRECIVNSMMHDMTIPSSDMVELVTSQETDGSLHINWIFNTGTKGIGAYVLNKLKDIGRTITLSPISPSLDKYYEDLGFYRIEDPDAHFGYFMAWTPDIDSEVIGGVMIGDTTVTYSTSEYVIPAESIDLGNIDINLELEEDGSIYIEWIKNNTIKKGLGRMVINSLNGFNRPLMLIPLSNSIKPYYEEMGFRSIDQSDYMYKPSSGGDYMDSIHIGSYELTTDGEFEVPYDDIINSI